MTVVWKAGIASEVWTVMIAARDAMRGEDLIEGVHYIVFGTSRPQNVSIDEKCAALSELSGAQIVDCVRNYAQSAARSVANALPPSNTKAAGE